MNVILRTLLSMSFSGGLLILALLLGKRFLKNRISRQWQYYIWLLVILRLLLPFGPQVSLLGKTYHAVDAAITQATALPFQQPATNDPMNTPIPTETLEKDNESASRLAQTMTTSALQEIRQLLTDYSWMVWLMVALALLIRKITAYQSFVRYIRAGTTAVCDFALLDRLCVAAKQAGIKKPIDLCVNPLISSPLLIDFFHPCIVLPSADIPEKDFRYIALHELTHYKRLDMSYKWLVQAVVCLHWFNPLVHLMSREITKACEFSCDEAVLVKTGSSSASDYGKTLLDAMATVGKYEENHGAVTLGGDKQLLKERLEAIMNFRRRSAAAHLLTGGLTLCVILCAVFVGIYPAAAAVDQPSNKTSISGKQNSKLVETDLQSRKDYASLAERYYRANSLPLFEITFPQLDKDAQRAWLDKLYAEGDFAFFSVGVRGLDPDSSLFADFAKKAYADEETAFFSILADSMDKAELELWVDRALKDENWAFQSMLSDRLDKSDEFDDLRDEKVKEWKAAQEAEYQEVGVSTDGEDYYYKGQLVNIFLDLRANESLFTLNMNPKGTVNIKIVRDAEDKITGVAYLTEEELTYLLEDMDGWDDKIAAE